jgi:MFS family permease
MSSIGHSASWVHRIGWALPPAQRVYAAFFLYAFSLGGLFPRMGEIQQRMGVGEGALGLALIGTACGTMVSLTWGHALIERVGYRRCLLWLLPATAVWYSLASWATAPWVLFAVLLPAGVGVGALEIIVNVEADRVEHGLGRRIMNRSHGFWSLGFFCRRHGGRWQCLAGHQPAAAVVGYRVAGGLGHAAVAGSVCAQ